VDTCLFPFPEFESERGLDTRFDPDVDSERGLVDRSPFLFSEVESDRVLADSRCSTFTDVDSERDLLDPHFEYPFPAFDSKDWRACEDALLAGES